MILNPMTTPRGSGFHDTISSLHESKPNKETVPQAGALGETVLCKHEQRDRTARSHDSQRAEHYKHQQVKPGSMDTCICIHE